MFARQVENLSYVYPPRVTLSRRIAFQAVVDASLRVMRTVDSRLLVCRRVGLVDVDRRPARQVENLSYVSPLRDNLSRRIAF